jgi:hypothetical protein
MLNPFNIIAVLSLLVSAASFVTLIFGHKHTVHHDYASELEGKIAGIEVELKDCKLRLTLCESKNKELMQENILLTRKLAKLD